MIAERAAVIAAPYWVTFPVPYYDSRRGGWPAVVVWRDGITGHHLCAESEQTFSTYAEALLESHYLGDDRVILERLSRRDHATCSPT